MGNVRIYTWDEAWLIMDKLDFEMEDNYYAVWDSPEEVEWARASWDALTQKGLTSYANEYEKKYVQTQLLTLAAMFCTFTEVYYKKKATIDFQDWFDVLDITILQAEMILGKNLMKEYQEKVIITEECWEENFEYEGVETYSDNWDAEVNAAQDLIRYHWRDVYDALIKKYREPRLLYLSLLQTQERSESLKWVENGMFPIAGGL